DWIYEVKHDGYRMLARISGEKLRLLTRTGKDWSSRLPHLVSCLKKLKLKDSLLDGEIVVPGPDGRTSFQALQNAFDAGADAKIVYYVFDAPLLEGDDLRGLALRERKARLQKLLLKKAKNQPQVRFSADLSGSAH